jgi:small subunit ribosomal protein S17
VQKSRVGVVVSDKMSKTRVVVVERAFRHPRYERVVKRSSRFKAHDERNEARLGDRVLIVETRPLSKDKRWRIKEILERAS